MRSITLLKFIKINATQQFIWNDEYKQISLWNVKNYKMLSSEAFSTSITACTLQMESSSNNFRKQTFVHNKSSIVDNHKTIINQRNWKHGMQPLIYIEDIKLNWMHFWGNRLDYINFKKHLHLTDPQQYSSLSIYHIYR